jgi:hypothetical protein
MVTVDERLAALEAQVTALTDRFATDPSADTPAVAGGTFWALDGLKQRTEAGSSGAVLYTGTVCIDDRQYDWQYGRTVDDVLADDWTDDWAEPANALAALGHPVRLRLLHEILRGRHGTGELAELEDLGTTGQLHHHLRQLAAAGWVRNAGRGHYEIPAERVVPLLTILIAAQR